MPEPDAAQVRAALVSPACRRAVADGNVGQIVRTVRQALNWTQADLGKRAGYSQAGISRVETGSTRLDRDLDALNHIATALNIPRHVLGLPAGRPTSEVDKDVQRREFLAGAVAITAMALLPRSIVNAARIGAA